MNHWNDFESILGDGIREFLKHKRALGKRYQSEGEYFRLLDRYLSQHKVTALEAIAPPLIESFLASRTYVPRVYNGHVSMLRRLFAWLVLHEMIGESPMHAWRRPNRPSRRPFIFSPGQVGSLLDLAAQLPPHRRLRHRGQSYRLAFAMMYSLGLRTGEVARLCRGDVDLEHQQLFIGNTKFSKDRLVPVGPKLAQNIQDYLYLSADGRNDVQAGHPLLMLHRDAKMPITGKSISRVFHSLIPHLGLPVPPGVAYPRAHHLRHSFAIGTLLRWYRAGINPSERIGYLSTFLGHVDPVSTAVYLTATADLLHEASHRFERFAAPVLEEVTP